jgi:hypothetical protein
LRPRWKGKLKSTGGVQSRWHWHRQSKTRNVANR